MVPVRVIPNFRMTPSSSHPRDASTIRGAARLDAAEVAENSHSRISTDLRTSSTIGDLRH